MKFLKIAVMLASFLFIAQSAAQAQENVADQARVAYAAANKGIADARPFGVGLVIIGAGVGIGWIARSTVESIARQPEMAGSIQTAMIIAAALIEGIAFFALIILMLFSTPY